MKTVLQTYNKYSSSAKELQQWLQENGFPKLKRTTEAKPNRFVINWGCSTVHSPTNLYLNNPMSVAVAANKYLTLTCLAANSVSVPAFTTDITVAEQWLSDGEVVLARTTLSGHSGQGIVICKNKEDLVDAPLYVKYKKKKYEFRIHVGNGQVIDFQQKKKRQGQPVTDTMIRNHHTGWVYCREGVELPSDAEDQAIRAVAALNLDFGAVDLIWNQYENKSYVLEVNTAPGLVGSTVEAYGKAIKQLRNV